MSLAFLLHYFMLNMFRTLIHPSSGACDLFVELFNGSCCSGTMRVGVTLWFCWGGVVSGYHTTPPQLNHTVTPTHIVPQQYNPWNSSTNKSQAPEDGCINVWNMLSIKWWNKKASDIKLVYFYSTMNKACYDIRTIKPFFVCGCIANNLFFLCTFNHVIRYYFLG